ncbi:unnamed protein product [Mytilus coruscus]|uniref:ZMYM2-like/QRICH1 C-terminal domain-containing protein n=1 Tax=Mytilus coruscus TaxID=42192 RepID=A0A6J8CRY4_MYTCO|nr:unnamed protein product [Mytilus coruscus]
MKLKIKNNIPDIDREYQPGTLNGFQSVINRHLRLKEYPFDITKDDQFKKSRDCLTANKKKKHLKQLGLGNHPNAAEALESDDEEDLYNSGGFGTDDPDSLLGSIWYMNTIHFGLRRSHEHRQLKLGDIKLERDRNEIQCLTYNERLIKTRDGSKTKNTRAYAPKSRSHHQDERKCHITTHLKESTDPKTLVQESSRNKPCTVSNENETAVSIPIENLQQTGPILSRRIEKETTSLSIKSTSAFLTAMLTSATDKEASGALIGGILSGVAVLTVVITLAVCKFRSIGPFKSGDAITNQSVIFSNNLEESKTNKTLLNQSHSSGKFQMVNKNERAGKGVAEVDNIYTDSSNGEYDLLNDLQRRTIRLQENVYDSNAIMQNQDDQTYDRSVFRKFCHEGEVNDYSLATGRNSGDYDYALN